MVMMESRSLGAGGRSNHAWWWNGLGCQARTLYYSLSETDPVFLCR